MTKKKYDIVIVGSGAGGATLAKELALAGMKVLVIERGQYYTSYGGIGNVIQFHEAELATRSFRYSEEGLMLLRTHMAGGSTVVSCGNGVRCLEKELEEFGIELDDEFIQTEEELCIEPFPKESLSKGSKAILKASRTLGYPMESMPKFVNANACTKCGRCFAGCSNKAKWTALSYLEIAEANGADIKYGHLVREIMIRDGKTRGVIIQNDGRIDKIYADKVILSAGGLATPVILQKSGIQGAGSGLFVDTFINVYGITEGLNQLNECPMALVNNEFYWSHGFILSTFMNPMKLSLYAELDSQALSLSNNKLLGLMVKIRDERSGVVYPDGRVSKPTTNRDQARLSKGIQIAKEILNEAGALTGTFLVSKFQGAHPGGTAAIAEVVNENLETEVKDLYVCDGSVLPSSPGLPPILTIIALAKRLAKSIL
jgi:choline dehydrogenase-like flavoprotein